MLHDWMVSQPCCSLGRKHALPHPSNCVVCLTTGCCVDVLIDSVWLLDGYYSGREGRRCAIWEVFLYPLWCREGNFQEKGSFVWETITQQCVACIAKTDVTVLYLPQGQGGFAQFKCFCFEIRKIIFWSEDTENTLVDKEVCIILVACDVWWVIM